MLAALLLLVAVELGYAAAAVSRVGITIGGHLEGANICHGKPQRILEHTVGAGSSGGVLNYFWQTGAIPSKMQNTTKGELRLPQEPSLTQLWVDYFIDGEAEPSVSMQPLMMAGQAFPDLMKPQNMRWDAGGLFGRNTVSTTFHRIKVPFQRSVIVQARYAAEESGFAAAGRNGSQAAALRRAHMAAAMQMKYHRQFIGRVR